MAIYWLWFSNRDLQAGQLGALDLGALAEEALRSSQNQAECQYHA